MAKPICDMCGKATERIVVKLFKTKTGSTKTTRSTAYTHRAGIGVCCIVRVNEIQWHPRKKRGASA